MGRLPAKDGDKVLEHHTEAIMILTPAIKEAEKIIHRKPQNPVTLLRALIALTKAVNVALVHIQAAEAIRLEESPRRIAALEREAKKREEGNS